MRKLAQKGDSGRSTYKIGYEAQSDTNENEEVNWLSGNIHPLHKAKEKPMKTTLTAQGQPLEMEIDTAASVRIVSKTTWKSVWKKGEAPLKVTKKTLKTYTGEPIPVCRKLEVWVDTPDGRRLSLPLVVVAGSGPSLLGTDWIRQVQIDWARVHLLEANPHQGKVEGLLLLHSEVFSDSLGRLQGVKVKLPVTKTTSPKFNRPR